MRPIDKGKCPLDKNGKSKKVNDYKEWRKDLIDRIGSYCAYCNMRLTYQVHVEHRVPKKPKAGAVAGSMYDWDNMLLACESCNKRKSNEPSNETLHYLPEYHNGLLAFESYIENDEKVGNIVLIRPKNGLSEKQKAKAEATIRLLQWQNVDYRDAVVDLRWKDRTDALTAVKSVRYMFEIAKSSPTYDADMFGEKLATQALESGFFILWFEEFHNEPSVLKWLIDPNLFKGVAQNCFHKTTFQPIPRNPSNKVDPL